MGVPAAENLRSISDIVYAHLTHGEVAEMNTAADLLDAIAALHQRTRNFSRDIYPDEWCPACRTGWPCPTARLLQGEADRG